MMKASRGDFPFFLTVEDRIKKIKSFFERSKLVPLYSPGIKDNNESFKASKSLYINERKDVNYNNKILNFNEENSYASLEKLSNENFKPIEYVILPFHFNRKNFSLFYEVLRFEKKMSKDKTYIIYNYSCFKDYLFYFVLFKTLGYKVGIKINKYDTIHYFEKRTLVDSVIINLDELTKKDNSFYNFKQKTVAVLRDIKSFFKEKRVTVIIEINQLYSQQIINKLLIMGFDKLYFRDENYKVVEETIKDFLLRRSMYKERMKNKSSKVLLS